MPACSHGRLEQFGQRLIAQMGQGTRPRFKTQLGQALDSRGIGKLDSEVFVKHGNADRYSIDNVFQLPRLLTHETRILPGRDQARRSFR
jgi:hypothetical protein